MCECSGNQSDSKPRSSTARASSTGCIVWSVGKISTPMCMRRTVPRRRRSPDHGRSRCHMPRHGSRNVSLGTGTPVVATMVGFRHANRPARGALRQSARPDGAPWPRPSRPRTSSSSRCPTPARRSGTAPTRPGSSRVRARCRRHERSVWDRPEYRFLFNSYYDAVGARHPRPDRGLVTRPSLAEVAAYRCRRRQGDARRARRR